MEVLGLGTHAAGDNAEFAFACADRALARDEQVFIKVPFARDVVVMAVDRLAVQRARRQMIVQRATMSRIISRQLVSA